MDVCAQGGTVSGTGYILHPDGTRVEFELKSEPLTQDQAEFLNSLKGDEENGSNTSSSS